MSEDLIDRMNAAWLRELPGLDPSALEVVGRVLVIAGYLEKSVNIALAEHALTLGQFDILATLRRQGVDGRLTPSQLIESVMLSSGGMTNRLDRLAAADWIRREADPADRRGVVVVLTAKGRRVIEAAAATRFAEAKESLPPLSAKEREQLASLLKRWLLELESTEG